MLKLFLFLSLITQVYAKTELSSHYYVDTSEITLSTIMPHISNDTVLYTIAEGRYSKRVKSKELLKVLKKLGYNDFETGHTYTKFEKRSPIDLSKIKNYVSKYYKQKYKNIKIKNIKIQPRSYIKHLDEKYIVKMPKKSELRKNGTLAIKLQNKQQLFFDFYIEASVPAYIAKIDIKRKDELSFRNTIKKSIILDKFKAMPVQTITQGTLQSKFHLKKDTVLTSRDVEIISLVKRGSMVSVILYNTNLSISFSAKALQSGKNGDTITIQKENRKKIKAVVIGRNRVEIR